MGNERLVGKTDVVVDLGTWDCISHRGALRRYDKDIYTIQHLFPSDSLVQMRMQASMPWTTSGPLALQFPLGRPDQAREVVRQCSEVARSKVRRTINNPLVQVAVLELISMGEELLERLIVDMMHL